MHRIRFDSPFYFGDVVDFVAPHASGQGTVLDIVLGADRSVYYLIDCADGNIIGGIFPAQMKLVTAAPDPVRSRSPS